ncbi:MAG: hypothetical protein LBV55_02120, partial [Acholeplasmatales bacterium]|nr:hypothetical protein [Acholeplasmatales bacterium]
MDVKGISCSSCGSTDIVFVTSTLCKCNHCGSKFIVEEQNKTIINANNIKIVNKEDELVYQENFYSFEKVKDEKDFTRDILIFLALSNHTPSDIFKGHFTPIIERPIFFTKFSIDSDVQYSADLGHNQRETFVDRDMQGDAFTNVRTVTHWFFNKGFYQTTNEILTCNTDSEPPYDTNNYIFENLIKTKCKVVNIENANLNINDLVLPSKQIHEYVLVRAKSLADENCLKSL